MKLDPSSLRADSLSSLKLGTSPLRDAAIFIAVTYFVSWLFWIPGGMLVASGLTDIGNLLLAIGSFAPLGVAVYMNLLMRRRTFDLGAWVRTFTLRRVIVAIVMPILILLPIILYRLYNNTFDLWGFVSDLRGAPFLLVGLFIISFGEETGWRGFLLERLDSYNLVLVNFLIAFAWFGWQIPLILSTPNDAFLGDSGQLLAAYLLFSVMITPFFNRLALRSGMNVALPALLRACLKTGFAIYLLQGATIMSHPYGLVSLAWLAILNALLFGQLWQGKPSGDESELERVMPLEPALK